SEQVIEDLSHAEKTGATGGVFGEGKQDDELLGPAVRVILEYGQASTSMIQRRLRVGYSRASRLIDTMEVKGYVSRFNGSKPRDVIIKQAQYREIFGDDTPFAEIPSPDHAPIGDFYRDK
ncbi:MAG: DNA translocase FtsK, partial [Clostridiaceae bacterium]